MDEKSKQTRIETPAGEVVASDFAMDPVPQEITVVRDGELAKLLALGEQAPVFLAAYTTDVTNPGLKDYDRAFRTWQGSNSLRYSEAEVVQILGAYLGNKCNAELDMEWVVVKDQYGTNYGIRSKTHEVLGFPFSTVMKRIENDESDFLHGVFYALKRMIEDGESKERNVESPD